MCQLWTSYFFIISIFVRSKRNYRHYHHHHRHRRRHRSRRTRSCEVIVVIVDVIANVIAIISIFIAIAVVVENENKSTWPEVELTSVSAHWTNLNFCMMRAIDIFISIRASRIPTQLLGPMPKGMYIAGSLPSFSAEEICKTRTEGWDWLHAQPTVCGLPLLFWVIKL